MNKEEISGAVALFAAGIVLTVAPLPWAVEDSGAAIVVGVGLALLCWGIIAVLGALWEARRDQQYAADMRTKALEDVSALPLVWDSEEERAAYRRRLQRYERETSR